MRNLGVKLQPINIVLANHGVGTVLRRRHRSKAFGQTRDPVPVAVPDFQLGRQSGQKGTAPRTTKRSTPILAPSSPRHLTSKLFHQKLHSVTDAQDGNSEMKDGPIHLGSVLAVDAGGPPAENDSLGAESQNLPCGHGVRDDFGIHLCLADPPGNDLGILGPEIEDQDSFCAINGTC